MLNNLGIQGYDYAEFYVGAAKLSAYWHVKAMGFDIKGYMGPETGVKDRVSYYLVNNNIRFVVTSAITPTNFEVMGFVNRHGDGLKRFSLLVDDVETAYQEAKKNGGIPVEEPHCLIDSHGTVKQASIKIYDDAEIVFTNYKSYTGIFKPGYVEYKNKITLERYPTGLLCMDHMVGNVRENEMNMWEQYFVKVLGFESYVDFAAGDIGTQYSALLSKVVRSKDGSVKNPINEPYPGLKKSQCDEYNENYFGTGIQHIAIATDNIIESVKALKLNGVDFLDDAPPTYYEDLKKSGYEIDEDIEELQAYGILCDIESKGVKELRRPGYLLQIFTKPISDRPTYFYEIVQRKHGSEGFGHGNFQALFEAIEREQARRGNLEKTSLDQSYQNV